MSATTELLLEDIKKTTQLLEEASLSGNVPETTRLSVVLKNLKQQLVKANETLNENRSVLKG